VRGVIFDSGFSLRPVPDGCELTAIALTDLRGSLPRWVAVKGQIAWLVDACAQLSARLQYIQSLKANAAEKR